MKIVIDINKYWILGFITGTILGVIFWFLLIFVIGKIL